MMMKIRIFMTKKDAGSVGQKLEYASLSFVIFLHTKV